MGFDWKLRACGQIKIVIAGFTAMLKPWVALFVLQVVYLPYASALCPFAVPGWMQASEYCYHLSITTMTWLEARDYCIERGGYLAEINSSAEQAVLDSLLPRDSVGPMGYWIGLEEMEGGSWVWTTSVTEATYLNWSLGEPNNSGANNDDDRAGEKCVHRLENGFWNDFGCHCSDQCKLAKIPNYPMYALCEAGDLE